MNTRPPPVPPENRSDKGPGGSPKSEAAAGKASGRSVPENPDKQGQQGNTKVNTTHQGYQQDR